MAGLIENKIGIEETEPIVAPDARVTVLQTEESSAPEKEAAFEDLIREYGGYLMKVALIITRSEEAAEEAVQNAYLKAWSKFNMYTYKSPVKYWLRTIIRNAALAVLESESRRLKNTYISTDADDVARKIQGIPSPDLDPSQIYEAVDGYSQLTQQLATMNPNKLTLLKLDAEGFGPAEISELTGIPLGTAASRSTRARQAAQSLLAESSDSPVNLAA